MKALLTNGLGKRRLLPWTSLSARQQALWQLLPARAPAITAAQLRLDHSGALHRLGIDGLRGLLHSLALMEAAGWAGQGDGGWTRRIVV